MNTALAALLVLTLSGVCCLFCCPETSAAATAEHCPLSRAERHCGGAETAATDAPARAESGVAAFDCCSLKLNLFLAKLDKTDTSQKPPASANGFFSFPHAAQTIGRTIPAAPFAPGPIIAARDLHIRHRVLRI